MTDDSEQSQHELSLQRHMSPNRVKGAMAMTEREHEVCRYMINSGDDAYEKTAKALDIELDTVRKHMKSVRSKVGFRSTMGVLIWLQRWYHLTAKGEHELLDPMPTTQKGRVLTLLKLPHRETAKDGE